jgi:hypothetical protein
MSCAIVIFNNGIHISNGMINKKRRVVFIIIVLGNLFLILSCQEIIFPIRGKNIK